MSDQPTLPEVAGRLAMAAEALGALGAAAALAATGERVPPPLERALGAVLTALDAQEAVAEAPAPVLSGVAGMARSLLAQAAGLVGDPGQLGPWEATDPAVLEGSGQASAAFAVTVQERFLPLLGDLAARLSAPGAAFLDVGVGAAHLAVALCQRLPALSAVGIDPWPPALERGRANVAAAGLDQRIALRHMGVEGLEDVEAFDLVWLPLSFIPAPAFETALPRLTRALRPGGWLLVGRFAGHDPLSSALADLRTLRSGGAIHDDEGLRVQLERAGLRQLTTLPRGSLGLMSCLAGRASPHQ